MDRVFYNITKRAFIGILLLLSNYCNAQKDSVQAVFEKPLNLHIALHYSYLNWDLGYTGFAFSNTYIGGESIDLIGAVFNDDLGMAIGIEGASSGGARGSYVTGTYNVVQSYSSFYFKVEPMLNEYKLFNFSVPIKVAYSSVSYPDTFATAYTGGGYGGRNRRTLFNYGFPSISVGLNAFVNVFRKLSIGIGAAYRHGFGHSGNVAPQDYSNFSFNFIFRIKIYTRKIGKEKASGEDYYSPQLKYK
jgi:hypothetical protein